MLNPRIITAKFDSNCAECNNQVSKGDKVLYYRESGKGHVLCVSCTEKYNRRIESDNFDEMVYESWYPMDH